MVVAVMVSIMVRHLRQAIAGTGIISCGASAVVGICARQLDGGGQSLAPLASHPDVNSQKFTNCLVMERPMPVPSYVVL